MQAGEHNDDAGKPEFAVTSRQGLAGLYSLETQWRDLERRQAALNFCHSWDWYSAILEAGLVNADEIRFFVVSRQQQACLILPLQWRRQRLAGLPLRCWATPQHPHQPFSDALQDAQHGAAAMAFLLNWLREHSPRPWDCLQVSRRLEDGELDCRRVAMRGFPCVQTRITRSKYLACAATVDLPAARHLARARRRLARDGELELVVADRGVALETAFVQFLQLERDGWKGRRGSAIALHPGLIGFYRRLIALGVAGGKDGDGVRLRPVIYLLRQAGRPIAAVFAVQLAGTCYLLKIARAQRVRRGSPGKLLIDMIRQDWCDGRSRRELNFVTDVAWVDGWSPAARAVVSCRWFNRGLRAGLLARLARVRAAVFLLARRLRGVRA